MKITQQNYTELKYFIKQYNDKDNIPLERKYLLTLPRYASGKGDIEMAIRWNCLNRIPNNFRIPILDNLYSYLNDNHIDTVLKKVMKELNFI